MNERFELACAERDKDNNTEALKLFLELESFSGYYAAAELCWFDRTQVRGAQRVINDLIDFLAAQLARVDTPTLNSFFEGWLFGIDWQQRKQNRENEVKQDFDQAARYFLKAYECNQEVYQIVPASKPLTNKPSIAQVNNLLRDANLFLPDALYQLAMFYIHEAELIKQGDLNNRTISENPTLFDDRIWGCLKVAADAHHPHAAYQLTQRYWDRLTPERRLYHAAIAADANRALHKIFIIHKDPITYRDNDKFETQLECNPTDHQLPYELTQKTPILSRAAVYSLFVSNTHQNTSKCILPDEHKAFERSKVNLLDALNQEGPLNLNQLRKRRLDFFEPKASGDELSLDELSLYDKPNIHALK